MKHSNPIETAVRILIIGVFALTTILSLASCGETAYSPVTEYARNSQYYYDEVTVRSQKEAEAYKAGLVRYIDSVQKLRK
jgi:hypothetical protein